MDGMGSVPSATLWLRRLLPALADREPSTAQADRANTDQ